jgi:hypothetical protein
MANNLIQIKRSLNTANATGLANGELAFTSNGDVLWIGANGAVLPIAGKRVPGTLTANQALVANSTSGIDKLITANLTLGGTSVATINAVANLTHLGTPSNTELATTWAIKNFVDLKVAAASNPQGSNGQFQYNDSGVLAGTNNMVFNNTTGQITIGNSTVNVQVGFTGSANSLAHFHGNQNAYVQVIMNNVNNGTRSSSDFIAENDLGSETENFVDLGINSSTYNDPAYSAMGAGDSYLYAANNNLTVGTADAGILKFITGGTTSSQIRAVIDASGNVGIGNTSPNAKLQVTGTANISGLTTISANLVLGAAVSANGSTGSAGHVLKSGGTGNVYWEAQSATVAGSNSQVQFNANGALAGDSGFTFDGVTDTLTVAGEIDVGANVTANTTALKVGNTTLTTTNAVFGGTIAANGGIGSTGQALISGGSANAFWSTIGNGTVTSVATANGIGGGTITGSGTLFAVGNNGIVANTSGIFARQANGISVDASGINVLANSGIVANSTGVWARAANGISVTAAGINVVGSNGISVNSTAVGLTTGSTLTLNSTGVHVNSALSITDLTLSGNLTINGTLTTVDTTTLTVKDSLIELANGNVTTDSLDIGIYGQFGSSGTKYTGLFRDATDGVYKLFTGSQTEPTTTVDTGAAGYTQATLQAFLNSGAFVANVGSVAITANSTVNVAIVANTLSLSTALPATSGGTGLNSVAVGDLLVGNSTNTITRLASGTDGYVLQINGTGVVAWNTLDGGTF